MKRSILLSLIFFSFVFSLQASNVQVSNVGYEIYPGQEFHIISFDIAWENSWRTSTLESNYDAAWVFFKFRRSSDGDTWHHGHIAGEEDGPIGVEMVFPADQKGMFIQRSTNGIGDVDFIGVSLTWQLMQQPFTADEEVEICVYAIEMVYIPEGPFELGDGASAGVAGNFRMANSLSPYTVLSEDAITLGGSASNDLATNFYPGVDNDFDAANLRLLPAAYPKGFAAFYAMKYEISQGQYTSFLNSLEAESALIRFPDKYGQIGNTIRGSGIPIVYIAESPERAANWLNWNDVATYADWAALRPMSEFEYEKACRGNRDATPSEYAWGTGTIYNELYQNSDFGGSGEIITNGIQGLGNCINKDTWSLSPARCGVFAASYETPTREQSGASFYGLLELTGNVYEIAICVNHAEGRAFNKAIHGNGYISNTSITGWPGINAGSTNGRGVGYRGGGVEQLVFLQDFYVSSRSQTSDIIHEERLLGFGGRLVRSSF